VSGVLSQHSCSQFTGPPGRTLALYNPVWPNFHGSCACVSSQHTLCATSATNCAFVARV
jgi:hypothetical protein